MQVKVCGITQQEQAMELQQIGADFIGFIFYPKSPRFLTEGFQHNVENAVGVFVNPSVEDIVTAEQKIGSLKYIQLHGKETPEFCKQLMKNYKVIKAFGVDALDNIDALVKEYDNAADLFLFDTKSVMHGGTGKKFDWSVLSTYTGNIPFLLSGGISPEDAALIKQLQHKMLLGVDVNSGFELSPGIKDLQQVKNFIQTLK